jgi:multisubunit Na+/H+ antiporter MnhG subunit
MSLGDNERANQEACWFCQATPSHSASAAPVQMHLGGFLENSHEYHVADKDTVYVPRCESCKTVHDQVEGHVGKGGIIGLLVGVVISLVALQVLGQDSAKDIWKLLLVVVVIFMMLGGLLAWMLGRAKIPDGVKDQRAREQHPAVQQKIQAGWKVGPKPPGL